MRHEDGHRVEPFERGLGRQCAQLYLASQVGGHLLAPLRRGRD